MVIRRCCDAILFHDITVGIDHAAVENVAPLIVG